ncbi:MAG: type III-A CRISPR-associated RAMP protein Csm3 [Chloroflexota bacterium]
MLEGIIYTEIKGIIKCKTGLHIGGTKDDIEIGGIDNPVIREPISKQPYIPGSSLKGKLRSLLEKSEGKVYQGGNVHSCQDAKCLICKVFGPGHSRDNVLGPTRIIVRDAFLTEDSAKMLKEKLEIGDNFTSYKQEVVIDRNKGSAAGAGPRTMEFVPPGAEFRFNIMVRSFNGEDVKPFTDFIKKGFEFLKKDYLGGSGSRGYGKVEISYEE